MDAHGNALRYDVELWLRLRIKAWKIDEEKLFSLSQPLSDGLKKLCVQRLKIIFYNVLNYLSAQLLFLIANR